MLEAEMAVIRGFCRVMRIFLPVVPVLSLHHSGACRRTWCNAIRDGSFLLFLPNSQHGWSVLRLNTMLKSRGNEVVVHLASAGVSPQQASWESYIRSMWLLV